MTESRTTPEAHRTYAYGQQHYDGDACRDCQWQGPPGSAEQHQRDTRPDAPTPTPAEQPFFRDKATGEPCPRRGALMCTRTDDHLHRAIHLDAPTPAGDDQREALDPRGLHDKFRVERTDGRSAYGQRHHGCRYFVLDLDHDEDASTAVAAYADAVRQTRPELAADLDRAWPAAARPSAQNGTMEREALARRLYETARHSGSRIVKRARLWERLTDAEREVWYVMAESVQTATVTTEQARWIAEAVAALRAATVINERMLASGQVEGLNLGNHDRLIREAAALGIEVRP